MIYSNMSKRRTKRGGYYNSSTMKSLKSNSQNKRIRQNNSKSKTTGRKSNKLPRLLPVTV